MIPAGQRDRLIVFERGSATGDAYGGETPAWAELARAYARVRYGTGQERREAAQEAATQAATFECNWTAALAGVRVSDRVQFDGPWDITSVAPIRLNDEIHFTAVRAA